MATSPIYYFACRQELINYFGCVEWPT